MTIHDGSIPVPHESFDTAEFNARNQAMETLKEALPLLWSLRDNGQIIDLAAPADDLYTDIMRVQPYYFSRNDPKQLGAWQLIWEERPPLYLASSQAPVEEGGVAVSLGVKINRQGAVSGEVDLERVQECAIILGFGGAEFARQQAASHMAATEKRVNTAEPRRRRLASGIGHVLRGSH